ncbi:GntR family transcriptional regulator [Frigidibacter sp. MR17.24]|uniref:GntR family transcriptional regulator n=1 Tax=Frigidibacter sp. MR17.24 TaxID=3127345 RepID=UPI003012E10F
MDSDSTTGRTFAASPRVAADPVPAPLFAALEPKDLVSRIADQVLQAISDGRLRPGEKVAEARLARELGTSRAPVREALRLLESQGLVIAQPRRGFFVHAHDATELAAAYDLRECLELHSAAAAVARVTPEAVAALRAQIALLHRMALEGRSQDHVVEDFAFHRMLLALGGNARILRVFDQLSAELRAGIALVGKMYQDPAEIAESHLPIIDALEARDVARLRAELSEHLRDAREVALRLYRDATAPDGL